MNSLSALSILKSLLKDIKEYIFSYLTFSLLWNILFINTNFFLSSLRVLFSNNKRINEILKRLIISSILFLILGIILYSKNFNLPSYIVNNNCFQYIKGYFFVDYKYFSFSVLLIVTAEIALLWILRSFHFIFTYLKLFLFFLSLPIDKSKLRNGILIQIMLVINDFINFVYLIFHCFFIFILMNKFAFKSYILPLALFSSSAISYLFVLKIQERFSFFLREDDSFFLKML